MPASGLGGRGGGAAGNRESWVEALRAKGVDGTPHALEAKGERAMANGRRELSGFFFYVGTDVATLSCQAAPFFQEAAEAFELAKNWKKAALAHREIAICRMKTGRCARLEAASSLLDCAYCYKKVFDPDDKEMVNTMEWALKKSLRMYVLEDETVSSASACYELAVLYTSQKQWQKAEEYYQRAIHHYANTNDPLYTGFATRKMRTKLSLLMEEAESKTHSEMYKTH